MAVGVQVVAVRTEQVMAARFPPQPHHHVCEVQLADGAELTVDELRSLMRRERVYMWDLDAGRRRYLRFESCPQCGEQVLMG